ncbi:MAG: hypothetical protein HKM04_09365 [Legionellales bacterium]|nr:hypothetical protein [Legionellales bacterium]
MNKKTYSQGMGLLDVLLAIAVSAVLLILGVNYYQNVVREQKMTQTIARIQAISSAVAKVIAQGTTQTTISSNTPNIGTNVQKMVSPSTLVSPWDRTQIQLGKSLQSYPFTNPQTNASASCLAFNITISGIPLRAQPILKTKFESAFPNSPAPTPNKKMSFWICVE